MQAHKFTTVDEYIATFTDETQTLLKQLRTAIKQAAPKAEEGIGYNMPAYKYKGVLVYFAGYKGHIGFYPGSSITTKQFAGKLKDYKTSKGTVQFPLDKKIPVSLVKSIVKLRTKENEMKEAQKKKKKTAR